MSLNSTGLIRFRRPRRKRWQINLENAQPGDFERFSEHFTREEWNASFKPRERRRRSRRRRRGKSGLKHKVSYPSRSRFRMSGGTIPGKTVTTGLLRKYIGGVHVPVFGVWETPMTVTSDLSAKLEKTWDQINPGPPYRSGGQFTNLKISLPHNAVLGKGTYSTNPTFITAGISWEYEGGFINPQFVGDPVSASVYIDSGKSPWNNSLLPSVAAHGPRAWSKLSPTPEQANVGQFLVELREAPRMISNLRATAKDADNFWRSAGGSLGSPRMAPKRAANEFLGYNFGWVPFIRDVIDVIDVTNQMFMFMERVRTMNNTWIRRRAVIDSGTTIERLNRGFNLAVFPQGITIEQMLKPMVVAGTNCSAYWDLHLENSFEAWAEGSFKFYRPEFDASLAEFDSGFMQMQRLMTLYGARVSPSLLWKVTPWTWLIDWFGHVGDNIENITSMLQDSVLAKYFYVMHRSTRKVIMTQVMNFWDRGQVAIPWVRTYESKQRTNAASPFGFNVPTADLSSKQWSILGALGISHLT